MTKTVLSILSIGLGLGASAQFGTAPNFTVTDIDGATHVLYDWLNDGKIVIVDASATWCGTCWGLHQSGALENVWANYGPDGTDQVRVLFYEADASTTLANLQGTGNTQGDWLTGTEYPVVNESPLTLNGNIWWPLGYPTVSLVRPTDKEITADMWNYSYNQMAAAIDDMIADIVSVSENETSSNMNLYPVPVADILTVEISAADITVDAITLTDATGRLIQTSPMANTDRTQFNTSELESGMYYVSMINDGNTIAVRSFVK